MLAFVISGQLLSKQSELLQSQTFRKKMNLPPLDLKWDKPCVGICYMQRVRGVSCLIWIQRNLFLSNVCILILRASPRRRYSGSRKNEKRRKHVLGSATSPRSPIIDLSLKSNVKIMNQQMNTSPRSPIIQLPCQYLGPSH